MTSCAVSTLDLGPERKDLAIVKKSVGDRKISSECKMYKILQYLALSNRCFDVTTRKYTRGLAHSKIS